MSSLVKVPNCSYCISERSIYYIGYVLCRGMSVNCDKRLNILDLTWLFCRYGTL